MKYKDIEGQISIFEYIDSIKPLPVDIRGLCDDAYCPRCNYCLDELKELDCKICPVCGVKIDWGPWHRMND